MSAHEKQIRQKLKNDFPHYASKCLKIRNKDGVVEPFALNLAQKHIHAKLEEQRALFGRIRALVLKGRQQGCSTYVGGRFYWRVTHSIGYQAFILTHALDATQNLYKMVQRYYENTPQLVKPSVQTSNAKELIFGDLDSGYKLGTAENKSVGRSATIQLLHGSEVAFWANAQEHAKGIMQAVPNSPGTEIILESTANGIGNYFHQLWRSAEAKEGDCDYIPIFVPWYWQPEYQRAIIEDFVLNHDEEELKRLYGINDQQLAWRRFKISELSINGIDGQKAFKQEYPFNSIEAFQVTGDDTFIEADLVMRARKGKAEMHGPKLVGVDPARYGQDRTSIIRRCGRVAYGLQSYEKKDVMEVTGLVVQTIQNDMPDKVFIDVGGLGAGVYDRCVELGYKGLVVPVNFGAKPFNAQRYLNKRAEMWGLMKDWLMQEPVQIPDSDSLHADLCAIKYSFDSVTRLKMEAKEDMKKRGIRSSDEADALALTFAQPAGQYQNSRNSNEIASKMMAGQEARLQARKSLYHDTFY